MPYGLYISAAGADVQAQRLQVITHNLANVDTPGFKREIALLQARPSEAITRGLAAPGSRSINDIGGGVRMPETATEFSRGKLRSTGNDTDFAVDSDRAFFVVEKDGQQYLTKAGNFQFDGQGRLITQQGYRVLASGGNPIQIDTAVPVQVLPNGRIAQQGAAFDLGLAEPASMGDLARVGENLFRPLAPVRNLVAFEERPRIVKGHLEMSGVVPAREMMQMIEASRAYEANLKLIQNQDHMMGALISRVLQQ